MTDLIRAKSQWVPAHHRLRRTRRAWKCHPPKHEECCGLDIMAPAVPPSRDQPFTRHCASISSWTHHDAMCFTSNATFQVFHRDDVGTWWSQRRPACCMLSSPGGQTLNSGVWKMGRSIHKNYLPSPHLWHLWTKTQHRWSGSTCHGIPSLAPVPLAPRRPDPCRCRWPAQSTESPLCDEWRHQTKGKNLVKRWLWRHREVDLPYQWATTN